MFSSSHNPRRFAPGIVGRHHEMLTASRRRRMKSEDDRDMVVLRCLVPMRQRQQGCSADANALLHLPAHRTPWWHSHAYMNLYLVAYEAHFACLGYKRQARDRLPNHRQMQKQVRSSLLPNGDQVVAALESTERVDNEDGSIAKMRCETMHHHRRPSRCALDSVTRSIPYRTIVTII